MVEVAFEAALKDKQDMNQMPKAKNKDRGWKRGFMKAAMLKVWFWDQQQEQHLGTGEIVKLSSPTLTYRMETLGQVSNPCNLNKFVK